MKEQIAGKGTNPATAFEGLTIMENINSTATTTKTSTGNKTATTITAEFAEKGRYSPLAVQDAVSRAVSAVLPTKQTAAARHGLQLFVIQTTFVITGIRSAYLLDTLTLDRFALERFLDHLDDHVASEIAICYDETTDQSFVFNPKLLEGRINSEDFPLWVPTAPPFSPVGVLLISGLGTFDQIDRS